METKAADFRNWHRPTLAKFNPKLEEHRDRTPTSSDDNRWTATVWPHGDQWRGKVNRVAGAPLRQGFALNADDTWELGPFPDREAAMCFVEQWLEWQGSPEAWRVGAPEPIYDAQGERLSRDLAQRRGVSVPQLLRALVQEEAAREGLS
jgi:hypothetical protein